MRIWVGVYLYACMSNYMYMRMYTSMWIYRIGMCTGTCSGICVCTRIHIGIYTHTLYLHRWISHLIIYIDG